MANVKPSDSSSMSGFKRSVELPNQTFGEGRGYKCCLGSSQATREDELTELNVEEKDLSQSISALKSGLAVLANIMHLKVQKTKSKQD